MHRYSTVYKLCALVDIHKTLMFLCCVPYLQISGSHALRYNSITLTDKTPKTGSISTKTCRSIHHTGLPIMLEGLKISATGSLALTQYGEFFYYDRYIYKKTCIYNSKIVLQTTTRIGEKESAFDKIIPLPK